MLRRVLSFYVLELKPKHICDYKICHSISAICVVDYNDLEIMNRSPINTTNIYMRTHNPENVTQAYKKKRAIFHCLPYQHIYRNIQKASAYSGAWGHAQGSASRRGQAATRADRLRPRSCRHSHAP